MPKIMLNNVEYGGGGSDKAADISYDNSNSKLTAEKVQAAIDEIVDNMNTLDIASSAADTDYDNTESGLDAKTVQAAIDEVVLTKLNGLSLAKCTQAEYDAMESHDTNTLYIIQG